LRVGSAQLSVLGLRRLATMDLEAGPAWELMNDYGSFQFHRFTLRTNKPNWARQAGRWLVPRGSSRQDVQTNPIWPRLERKRGANVPSASSGQAPVRLWVSCQDARPTKARAEMQNKANWVRQAGPVARDPWPVVRGTKNAKQTQFRRFQCREGGLGAKNRGNLVCGRDALWVWP